MNTLCSDLRWPVRFTLLQTNFETDENQPNRGGGNLGGSDRLSAPSFIRAYPSMGDRRVARSSSSRGRIECRRRSRTFRVKNRPRNAFPVHPRSYRHTPLGVHDITRESVRTQNANKCPTAYNDGGQIEGFILFSSHGGNPIVFLEM